MATLCYELVQTFSQLHEIAVLLEDYEAAAVYSTAADLSDAILKGRDASAVSELVSSLRSNAQLGEQSEAWLTCVDEVHRAARRHTRLR